MSKKIVITGGIGYIGTELCKIYSGISWNNEILVIDNRFVSERVNQLRNWGIDFIHGDILDKDLVNRHCKDADIVHHLAGITDVPRVKNESSSEKDSKIKLVAEEGTQKARREPERVSLLRSGGAQWRAADYSGGRRDRRAVAERAESQGQDARRRPLFC
mgnify:CR=1 FL=1